MYDKTAPTFFINGLKNFSVDRIPFERRGSSYRWTFSVDYKRDTPKRVHLSVEHKNPKLRCWIGGDNDAYPNFESQLNLYDSSVLNGLYNFVLLVIKEGDSVQSFPFQITVTGSKNCGEFLNGLRFLGDIYGAGSENLFKISTTIPAPGSDTLIFHHLRKDISLVTIPNCYDQTIFIPKQQIGDTTYSGVGTMRYNFYYDGATELELAVLEEAGTWGATAYYRMFSR